MAQMGPTREVRITEQAFHRKKRQFGGKGTE
jgi:hypothetical protein